MGTFRTHKKSNFVVLDKGFLNDSRLSLKSKGLLCLMLSYPDGWQFYEKELVKHTSDKITSLRSGVQELIQLGYITRNRKRNDKGQFKEYEYNVFETPMLENPILDKPILENRTLLNNNIIKNNLIKNNNGADVRVNISTDTHINDLIDMYFKTYSTHYKKPHPQLKEPTINNIKSKIHTFIDKYNITIDLDLWNDMIISFFNNVNTNGNINHFTKENILKYRYYEAGGGNLDC